MIKCPNCNSPQYVYIPKGKLVGKVMFYQECMTCDCLFNTDRNTVKAKGGRRVLME
jgi:hypothetical protein